MGATDIRHDLPAVLDFEYIELYVSNLYQAAHFFRSVLGFEIVADSKRNNRGEFILGASCRTCRSSRV